MATNGTPHHETEKALVVWVSRASPHIASHELAEESDRRSTLSLCPTMWTLWGK